MKKSQKIHSTKPITLAYWFTLISFILPIAYLIFRIILGNEGRLYEAIPRTDADYGLMIVQCVLGIVVLHVPGFLSRRFKFDVPNAMYILYILFLYCAIFLGEVRNFYYEIPHWDTILHGFSSVMTGLFGFMVVAILNESRKATIQLSPIFVALFAFCFSVTIGTLWEIYEFTFDGMLGMNMQKSLLEDGSALIGRHALSDTMEDIIVDGIGALIASVFGYFSLKHQKGWLHSYLHDGKKE